MMFDKIIIFKNFIFNVYDDFKDIVECVSNIVWYEVVYYFGMLEEEVEEEERKRKKFL